MAPEIKVYALSTCIHCKHAKEYLEIKRECAKEEMKTKGKWCEKYSKIEKLYNQLQSESLRSMPQAPKF